MGHYLGMCHGWFGCHSLINDNRLYDFESFYSKNLDFKFLGLNIYWW